MSKPCHPLNRFLVLASLIILAFGVSSPTFGQENRFVEMGAVSNFRAPNPKESNRPISTRTGKPAAKTVKPSPEELKREVVDHAIKAGNAARDGNNYELALANYRRVITELKSEDERAYYGLGNVYADLYCHDSAVEAYLNAIKRKTIYLEALIGLGYAYAGKERFDDAESQFRAALKIKSDSADANIGLGRAHLIKGKYQDAINQFNLIINSPTVEVKDKATAHVGRGDVYWKQDNRADAIKEFEEAIHLKPDFAWAHVELGNARAAVAYSKGYFNAPTELSPQDLEEMLATAKRATAHLEDARKYGYNHPQIHGYMALSLAYRTRYDEALAKIDDYFAEVERLKEKVAPMASGCGVGIDRLRAEAYWYRGNISYLQGLVATDANRKNEFFTAARGYWLDSIKSRSDYVSSIYMLGIIYTQLGKHEDAIEQYKKALSYVTEEPVKASLYGAIGIAYNSLGKHDEAAQNGLEAIRRSPNKPEYYRWLGGTYISLGKLEDALAQFQKAEELRSPDSDSKVADNRYYILGVAYGMRYVQQRNERDFNEAVNALRKMVELRPKFASAYDTLGGLYLIKGDAKAALENYEKAITLDPKNPFAYLNAGRVYSELKKNDDAAIEHFKKAIEIKPDLAWAHRLLGQLYHRRKNDAEAITYLQDAIRHDSNDLESYLDLAGIYRLQKNYSAAIKYLTTAIGIAPKKRGAYHELGLLYLEQKNYPEAIKYLTIAKENAPDLAWIYKDLAKVYEAQGKNEEAIRYYDEAQRRLDANDLATKELYLGRKARLAGNYADAIEHFRKVNYQDESGQSNYEIGVVYVVSKKKKLAREQLNQLLKLKSPLAEDLRHRIEEMK